MTEKKPELAALTSKELELIKRIAQRDGITEDEAATNLAKAGLARRVRKRTGKPQARIYDIKRK